MPTHAQLASQLLRDAAAFFETIAEQNEPLRAQMLENAAVFKEVAHLNETDPTGEIQGGGEHGDGEGGCCGGHHHHHHHGEEEACEDKGKKDNCDGKGGCGCH